MRPCPLTTFSGHLEKKQAHSITPPLLYLTVVLRCFSTYSSVVLWQTHIVFGAKQTNKKSNFIKAKSPSYSSSGRRQTLHVYVSVDRIEKLFFFLACFPNNRLA
ncbi:hypothetical protein ILYODFUR_034603 [Ilyodon furcidens]|uniref:Uncharacterized protein n=1 Tax=Ilyodon furcidens TaxID=33524 RepID=A0ABV0T309_9TELE